MTKALDANGKNNKPKASSKSAENLRKNLKRRKPINKKQESSK